MNDDVEIDLEIYTAQTIEDTFREWQALAAERDMRWVFEEEDTLAEFDFLENEAILNDIENGRGSDFSNYRAYLQTDTWKVRAARVNRWGICMRCGERTSQLDAHHRTYERLGRERPGDLEALCRACHQREHGRF